MSHTIKGGRDESSLAFAFLGLGCVHSAAGNRFVMGPPSGALDGKTFAMTLVVGKATHSDHLKFQMGAFLSVARDDDNFRPAVYSTERAKDGLHFRSQAKSSTDGTNNWTGVVRGDTIEGRLVWIDKQGRVTEFEYRGKLASTAASTVAGVTAGNR